MPYPPAKRRQNLVYAACHRWVRDRFPGVYKSFVWEAKLRVPELPPGRHPVAEAEPTVIVPVPVREYTRMVRKTLRPMNRKGNDRHDRQL